MFKGFPADAVKFFRDLSKNNNREWFHPRKEIFETKVKAPMVELVEAVNAEFARFAPEYITDSKKAVYRIYRDLRFSADKSPYKTHIAAAFSRRSGAKEGSGGHGTSAGYFFSIGAKEVGLAGGVYEPSPEQTFAVRSWLAENHAAFRKLTRAPEKLMGEMHGASLTRMPKGFPADHPAGDLLKRKQWIYWIALDPKLATTPKLLPELIKHFKAMLPMMEALNQPLVAVKKRAAVFD
jgi:uncharacterized protein (TIGR02453 family)